MSSNRWFIDVVDFMSDESKYEAFVPEYIGASDPTNASIYRLDDEIDTTLAELLAMSTDKPLPQREVDDLLDLEVGEHLWLHGGCFSDTFVTRVS
jgi:hypothetical protein